MEEIRETSIFDEETLVTYGGFWERFGALFLDGIILAPVTILNYYSENRWGNMWLVILCNPFSIAYKPVLEYWYGATPGKKALSLTVVNHAYGSLRVGDAILRNIFGIVVGITGLAISLYTLTNAPVDVKPITSLNDINNGMLISVMFWLGVLVLYLADAICLAANNKKQSLHDLIAKTYVVRR